MVAKITMIDYGASNIRSAYKAFEHIGANIALTADPDVVAKAERLVLPGVGAFGSNMAALRQRGLEPAIHAAVDRGVLLLGICIGMQFLFDSSDEMGNHAGLGLIPGRVTHFKPSEIGEQLKIPHMGWNQIEHDATHPLLERVPNNAFVYFVHSYYCVPNNQADIIAKTGYGRFFTSVVGRDNIYGLQFHPEKSQKHGLQILRNFVKM